MCIRDRHVVGIILMGWPLMVAIVAPISGVLSDRIPAEVLGGIGMLIASSGMLLLAFVPQAAQPRDFVWRLCICGAGFGCYFSPNSRLIIGSTPHQRVASVGGLMSTNRLLGQTLGATLMAALLAYGLGNGRAPALIGAALMLIAAVCSMARLKVSS